MSVVIVDYDVGNLHSVAKAFEKVGAAVTVSRDADVIAAGDAVVLPGVGAFGACMDNLDRFGLVDVVVDAAKSGRPFLGICVGYQILFDESPEFGPTAGLGIIPGACAKFSFDPSRQESALVKIPHMGWNQIHHKSPSPLLAGIEDGADFYFVHSYFPVPIDSAVVIAETEYGGKTFAAAIQSGSLFATQFHPEKSQRIGLQLIENFTQLASA